MGFKDANLGCEPYGFKVISDESFAEEVFEENWDATCMRRLDDTSVLVLDPTLAFELLANFRPGMASIEIYPLIQQ